MRDFAYAVAEGPADAVAALAAPGTVMIAGGTELLNWLRLGIADPERVVDVGRIRGLDEIKREGDQLSIGALATLAEIGEHPLIREHAAVLGQACLKSASVQIRNRATIGGNVLQKTRCAYFRSEAPLAWGCNKRDPGSGCAAISGANERHAILGWTDVCVATHPADPAVALAALDAVAEVVGPSGRRSLAIADFHLTQQEARAEVATGRLRLASPAHEAQIETRLAPDEMIVAWHIPIRAGERSAYVKVRERESYEYALVSAAAALSMDGGRISRARVALGSVAQKPWRLPGAEAALVGKRPTRDDVLPQISAALAEARPLSHNGYKVTLAANAAVRAVVVAGDSV